MCKGPVSWAKYFHSLNWEGLEINASWKEVQIAPRAPCKASPSLGPQANRYHSNCKALSLVPLIPHQKDHFCPQELWQASLFLPKDKLLTFDLKEWIPSLRTCKGLLWKPPRLDFSPPLQTQSLGQRLKAFSSLLTLTSSLPTTVPDQSRESHYKGPVLDCTLKVVSPLKVFPSPASMYTFAILFCSGLEVTRDVLAGTLGPLEFQ